MRTSTATYSSCQPGLAPAWSPVPRYRRPRQAPDRSAIPTRSMSDLGLVVGETARLFPDGNEDFAFEVRLVGWIGRQCVLVTQPSWAGRPMAMNPGEGCRLRLFHGKRAISFTTTVLGAHDVPAPCLALAFPDEINVCEVRAEERVPTRITAQAAQEDRSVHVPCSLLDLSVRGMRLHAASPVVPPGARLVVRFAVSIGGLRHEFALPGEVRNLAAAGEGPESGWDHGIELDPLPIEEAVILKDYLASRRAAA